MKRFPTYAQNQSFRELWCDNAWAAMPRVPEAELHRREPSPEPVFSFDAACLTKDYLDDIESTYTDSSDEELEELQEVPRTSLEIRNRKQQTGRGCLQMMSAQQGIPKMHAVPSYANVDASSIDHRTILFEARNIRYVRCKQREMYNAVLPINFVRVSLNVCIHVP